MAKKHAVDVTPRDIARALHGISTWARSVRSTLLKMNPKTKIRLRVPSAMMDPDNSVPPQVDGCPPRDPRGASPKAKKKKKTKKGK
jgi:hypothetical protein